MDREDDDQTLVRAVLEERPDEDLPDGFDSRLSARLDEIDRLDHRDRDGVEAAEPPGSVTARTRSKEKRLRSRVG